MAEATWHEIQGSSAPQGRSSHSISYVNLHGKEYIYVIGGENIPRVPLDTSVVHVLDLATKTWSDVKPKNDVRPRDLLAHTSVSIGHVIYLFGGRDLQKEDLGDLWTFDAETVEWKLVWGSQSAKAADAPLKRSYHAMTTNGTSLYIFGGCHGKGRLEDTWEYNIQSGKWTRLAEAGPGVRGGAALVHHSGKLYVFFGFNGKELSDIWALDLGNVAQGWTKVETSGDLPGPRSVSAIGSVSPKEIIVFGGECEPSAQGHEGAGRYLEDTAVLNVETMTWRKINAPHPTGRGWTASCSAGPNAFAVHGGFGGADRLGDIHIFKLN